MHKIIAPIVDTPDETATTPTEELELYRGIATRVEEGSRDMLSRFRQLHGIEGLSEKHRAAIAEHIADYEASIARWERIRAGLDRMVRWWR
jgi:hypothetical protein